MAELLQRFSGNPFATTVGQKIGDFSLNWSFIVLIDFICLVAEQATDPSLASENWALDMEITDIVNDTDEGYVFSPTLLIDLLPYF